MADFDEVVMTAVTNKIPIITEIHDYSILTYFCWPI